MLPWAPLPFEKTAVHALKAMSHGTATDAQQKMALEFIVVKLCETDGLSFRPDDMGGSRAADFAEGKRFVGLQLRKFILMSLDERGEAPRPYAEPKPARNRKPKVSNE
jgi:hypothetical protein